MGKAGQTVPTMTDEWLQTISSRYIELYEKVTGQPFIASPLEHQEERISMNVTQSLTELGII
jgi:phosphoribosylaminoimidazole-succinocarboxamide synthase